MILLTRALLLAFAFIAQHASAQVTAADIKVWDRPRQQITDAWRVRREVMSIGGDPAGLKQLEQIRKIQLQYGISSLPEVSLSLLKEAKDRGEGKAPLNSDRLHYAELFSPRLPSLGSWYCSITNHPDGLFMGAKSCLSGVLHGFARSEWTLRFLANLFLVLFSVLSFMTIAVGACFAIKYAVPVCRSWASNWKGISPIAILILFSLLLILSFLGIGGIGLSFLLISILWRYATIKEKVLMVCLSLGWAFFPFALYAPALYLNYQSGIVPILEEPLKGISIQDHASRLNAWLAENPSDAEAVFTMARIEKETGRLENARELYMRATSLRSNWYKPLANLAVIQFVEGSSTDAINSLQRATAMAPGEIIPQFNLSKLLLKETRLDEGKSALKKTKDIDSQRFSDLDHLSDPKDPNEFLIDDELTQKDLNPRIWNLSPDVVTLRDRLYLSYIPALPTIWFWALLMIAPVVGLIIARKWPAPKLDFEGTLDSRRASMTPIDVFDPNSSRSKHGRSFRTIWKNFLRQWSTLLAPGIHRFFRDEPIAALLWLSLATLFFVPNFIRGDLLSDPYWLSGFPTFPLGAIFATLFVLTYLIQFFNAMRR